MSVVEFRRRDQKQQLIDLIEDFDFDKGSVLLFMDEDFDSKEGSFSMVSTYESFGMKEAFAAESVAAFVKQNAYTVEEE